MKRFLFFLVPACILVFGGCGGKPENPAGETQVVADDPEKINKLIADYLHDHFAKADTSKRFRISADSITAYPEVIKFYSSLGDKPIWSDKGKLNASGDSMWAVVKDAESYGLIPGDYHYSVIDSLLKNSYDSVKEQFNVNRLAQTDMMLTDAFFTFAVHVSVGRIDNDSSTARSWKIHRLDTDLVSVLASTLKANTFRKTFAALEPQRMEYQSIKKYMNDYRRKYAGITWAHLPDRKEDSTGFFAGVKERLIEYGDYDTASTEKDSLKLSNALKKFQKRFFLEQDGKIGRNTVLTLDMTPQDWTRQLAMNMERWRWEPEKFEKRHMIVNLPVFKMTVWEADTIVMQSKIVCGAVKTQTPELDSKMNQIILYPFWNVPYSISWKEILPHVKRDTGYLRREHYEVLDLHNELVDPKTVKWSRYGKGNLPFKFRQMTGDDNALGIMKFDFPNKYSVYMHDTNAKKYFRYETRAFSHGCMRLQDYMDLAHFLIRDDSVKLPRDTFDFWTTTGDQRKINLKKPLPIHVRYFTCDVDTDGNVFLHSDIYLRDRRMMRLLYADMKNDHRQEEKDSSPAGPADTKKKSDRKAVLNSPGDKSKSKKKKKA